MAIEFITEDGTGKSDATAYVTVAEFRQYWLNRGVTYPSDVAPATTEDDKIKGYLNLATEYIDSLNFDGCKADYTNALMWPRYGMKDENGVVLSTAIPKRLKDAVCFAGSVSTSLNQIKDGVSSESYGPVSKTYNGKNTEFPLIEKLLAPYLIAGNTLVRVN